MRVRPGHIQLHMLNLATPRSILGLMITRTLDPHARRLAGQYPVVTLTGPRQSGKTTFARAAFPQLAYVSLESPAERDFATHDPVGFLSRFGQGVILDEVHRAPDLPSYIQGMVDEDPTPGRFILTGSHNFLLLGSVTQSMAGRTTLIDLLPLDLEEIRRFPDPPGELDGVLQSGGYPRIHERRLDPSEWLDAYVATYVERDVRALLNIGDLSAFQVFLRLCAGRVGQLLNLSSLAAECGIAQPTARRWLSVLEASFIVFRLGGIRDREAVPASRDPAAALVLSRARATGDRPRDRRGCRPSCGRGQVRTDAVRLTLRRLPHLRESPQGAT